MAYVYKHKLRGWYLVVKLPSGRRSQIYLGEMPKSRAETIARRVDDLTRTNSMGLRPDPQIADWLSCCPTPLLEKLERAHRVSIPRGTKTGARVFPLFPQLERELAALYAEAPDGATWVFNRGRNSAATEWRRWIIHAVKDAGLIPWPDIWHNLRRSARTDAEKRFPNHVCNAWFGHSARVAERHYLMIEPETWAAAADAGLAPTPLAKPRAVRRAP